MYALLILYPGIHTIWLPSATRSILSLSSFGHLLAKGVRTALQEEGAIGILTGGLTAAAAGVTTSLVCGVVCSWFGKSHDQN